MASPQDDYAANLARLASEKRDEVEQAVAYFAQLPLDAAKTREVSQALNRADRPSFCTLTLPALVVWGTADNVPLLMRMLREEGVERRAMLDLAQAWNDPRLIEVLVEVLEQPFDDGRRAEEILAAWGPEADALLARHMNHPNDEAHGRLKSVFEKRKTSPTLLARQAAADLASTNAQTQEYAAEWLATAAEIPAELHAAVCGAALAMVKSKRGFDRLHANQLIGRCATVEHNAAFLALLASPVAEEWQAGLQGVLATGDVAGAKALALRMTDPAFTGLVARTMQEFGPQSEDLALAILKQSVNKEQPAAHLGMAHVLRDLGGRKSLAALKSLAARRGIPDSINTGARDAAAHIEQRLKAGPS